MTLLTKMSAVEELENRFVNHLFLFTFGLVEAVDLRGNLLGRKWVRQMRTAVIRLLTNDLCLQFKKWVDLLMRRPVADSRENFTIPPVKVC